MQKCPKKSPLWAKHRRSSWGLMRGGHSPRNSWELGDDPSDGGSGFPSQSSGLRWPPPTPPPHPLSFRAKNAASPAMGTWPFCFLWDPPLGMGCWRDFEDGGERGASTPRQAPRDERGPRAAAEAATEAPARAWAGSCWWPHLPQMRKESWSQFPQAWSYLVGNLRGSQLHVCLSVVVIQFPVLVTQSPLYILWLLFMSLPREYQNVRGTMSIVLYYICGFSLACECYSGST